MSRVGIFCGLIFLLAGGCASRGGGYHWSSLYRQEISTVAVPIFASKDYHRGVEFQVSDALVKKIEEFTPYKVVPRERADTILEGEIVAVRPLTVTLDPHTATPQEEQYSIVVNFTWKNLHDGKVLVSRRDFEQTVNYYPTLGEGQYVPAQTAAERLALAIVHEMEAAW